MSYAQNLSTGVGIAKSQIRNTALTSTFVETLDLCATLLPRVRAAKRDSSKALLGGALGIALCLAASMPANAVTESDHYKLYLHSRVIDFKQYLCAVDVAHHESRWRPNAKNGSHYGLFQMRNIKVKTLDPYTQIDWWLRYVKARYNNKPCNALKHWDRFGWQ